MGNNCTYTSTPGTQVTAENGLNTGIVWAASTVRGYRRNQEDRFKTVMNLHNGYSYFAVFDGHGGFEIAEYLRRELHFYIAKYLHLKEDDVELALQLSFLDFDSNLRHPATIEALNGLLKEAGYSQAEAIVRRGVMSAADFTSPDTKCIVTPPSSKAGGPTTSKSGNPEGNPSSSSISGSANSKMQGHSSQEESISLKPSESTLSMPSASSGVQPSSSSGPIDSSIELPGPSNAVESSASAPLYYLLNEELASTSTDDSDFDIDQESSQSEDSEYNINAEEFMRQEPGDMSGSTATVVLVGREFLYLANVGDSRCVLSRGGEAVELSVDHNLDNPEERVRVTNAGATISSDGRVNGTVNISRAFGDFSQKGSTDIPVEQPVTAEPFIRTVRIEKGDDFVIIASDGIWNCMSNQTLVDFVSHRMKDTNGCLLDICEDVFRLIRPDHLTEDGLGTDNMTMIIVKLNASNEHNSLLAPLCAPIVSDDIEEDDDDEYSEEQPQEMETS